MMDAKAAKAHIVLPEPEDPRVLQVCGASDVRHTVGRRADGLWGPGLGQAAAQLVARKVCHITLLGKQEDILPQAEQMQLDLSGVSIVDPASDSRLPHYAETLYEMRKHKGNMSMESVVELLTADVSYFGTMMVQLGDADGMVSGATHTTANTIRPALQIIKTLPGIAVASSVFFMLLEDEVLVYGDCAVNVDPTPEQLAAIAISSAETATTFGIEPRVAMLSYSSGSSGAGPHVDKVDKATKLAQQARPDLAIEGPLQYDAAINPDIAKLKVKGETRVAGKATVLVFPDLNTGNNTYKAVQQAVHCVAMGPLMQGLRKPVNDLSRGCTVADIVNTVCMTCMQAAHNRARAAHQLAAKGHL